MLLIRGNTGQESTLGQLFIIACMNIQFGLERNQPQTQFFIYTCTVPVSPSETDYSLQ